MQDLMQNKNMLIVLGLLVAIAIYMGVTGGFNLGGGGDLPSGLDSQAYMAESGTAPPPVSAPPVETPSAPPSSAPPSSGEIGMGAPPVSAPPSTPSAPSSTPSSSMGINEKLLSFRGLDPDAIIEGKYKVLEESVTEPEKFAEDIGRVDPLTVVNQFIPPELRPPRKGETNDEKVLGFLEEVYAHDVLSRIRLNVDEVINAGNQWFVLMRFGPGEPTPVPVGGSIGISAEGLRVTAIVDSADREKVVFILLYSGEYSDATRTVTMISPTY